MFARMNYKNSILSSKNAMPMKDGVADGTADFAQNRTITNYISNSNGNFVVLNSSLTTPTNGSQYQIYPKIEITGSGTETVNAVARALINSSSSNSIYRVEFLERGQNYTYVTARPLANSVVPVSREADLRVIHPPKGGHGYDVYRELYTKDI